MKQTFLFGFFLVLSGCVSLNPESVTVSESENSLLEIRRAITSVIGEPRKISENQREFTSQYFSKKPDPQFDPQKSKVRHYAVMTILGQRRPYDIEIRAFVEVRNRGIYEPEGEDSVVSNKLAKELQNKLNQSRDTRNIIDDFRAF